MYKLFVISRFCPVLDRTSSPGVLPRYCSALTTERGRWTAGTEGRKLTRGEELASGRQSVNHHCFDTAALCVLYPAKVRLIYPRLRSWELLPVSAGDT